MKTKTFYISIILSSFFMLLTTNSYAQKKTKALFLRVYTLEGKKIKGNIKNFNDSLLVLQKGEKEFRIESKNIKTIKTKRSGGGNVVAGALVGALVGGLIGSSQETDWLVTKETNIAGYGIAGAAIGGAVGALTLAAKKSKKYHLDGDLDKWQLFIKSENLKN